MFPVFDLSRISAHQKFHFDFIIYAFFKLAREGNDIKICSPWATLKCRDREREKKRGGGGEDFNDQTSISTSIRTICTTEQVHLFKLNIINPFILAKIWIFYSIAKVSYYIKMCHYRNLHNIFSTFDSCRLFFHKLASKETNFAIILPSVNYWLITAASATVNQLTFALINREIRVAAFSRA